MKSKIAAVRNRPSSTTGTGGSQGVTSSRTGKLIPLTHEGKIAQTVAQFMYANGRISWLEYQIRLLVIERTYSQEIK